jgi:hypothetical protein
VIVQTKAGVNVATVVADALVANGVVVTVAVVVVVIVANNVRRHVVLCLPLQRKHNLIFIVQMSACTFAT